MKAVMKIKSLVLGLSLAATAAFGAAAENWKLAVTDVEGMERL
jgi:phosphonate transport system substrate-binding protein